ncbi:30S ribosomal protein S6 [Petrotoga sp. 9PW.55.5.1]|uniref:30S ribosomal protein S6 n=1 Tax=Petrotoga sp. 9PW.55.5.1 TaxID=1308979 RepID=UPI000DD9AABB|nr:30S ribosomal protein S6 [Petrotoga sp. 9PW.55.5.1]
MSKRYYETMFVVRTDLPEEERNALAEKVRGWIENQVGGEVEEFTRWGIRKLAYRTQKGKFTDGDYTYIIYNAEPEKINQLDELFKVNQQIFRFQTIRREDLEKKVRKTQKKTKIKVEEPEVTEEI